MANLTLLSELFDYAFEIVEIKGQGHPDTVCDALAEEVSGAYSRYCMDHFGFILPHMIDKIGVLGGLSECAFGAGELTKPITILLNGRLSRNLGDNVIPAAEIAYAAIRRVMCRIFPLLDYDRWVVVQNNLHFSRGPGVVSIEAQKNERIAYYGPRSAADVMHASQNVLCNDTSVVVAYAPQQAGEGLARGLEQFLFSAEFKSAHPFVGTDIKIMVVRIRDCVNVTCCVPFICANTPSFQFYRAQKEVLHRQIMNFLRAHEPTMSFTLSINTRDDYDKPDLYLTVIGSAIESGDEGLVGRGNRANGVINITGPMSIEAFAGKNPVHHVGKVYATMAQRITDAVYATTGMANEVYMVAQMGRPIDDPWQVVVKVCGSISEGLHAEVDQIIVDVLENNEAITMALINRSI